MSDRPLADADHARLRANATGWLSTASLRDIAALLAAIQDVLIERHSPAAALVAGAESSLRRQIEGGV